MTTCDWFDNGAGTTLQWVGPEDSVDSANRYLLTQWGSSAVHASTESSVITVRVAAFLLAVT